MCIVDTGMELNHPDLEGFDVAGWVDIVQGKSNPYDDHGHGTNMAGILVANGWINGIAKDVNLYVAKALLANGSGYEEDVVAGIDWCIGQNVSIISLSLGGAGFVSIAGFQWQDHRRLSERCYCSWNFCCRSCR